MNHTALKQIGKMMCIVSIGISVSSARAQTPLGTAFTYQGDLRDGGTPVNDTCDFDFSLWDDPAAGIQVGSTVSQSIVIVDGLLTTTMDFGDSAFTGAHGLWLQIAVCCPPDDCGIPANFTTLDPRQKLTPAPYALALPGFYTQEDATSPNLIGGYADNLVEDGAIGATIGGGGQSGSLNRVFDDFGAIGGGNLNTAGSAGGDATSDRYATVAGGRGNSATGDASAVGGGNSNVASGDWSTIAGGKDNQATGELAFVAGGNINVASGQKSTVVGGTTNTASGIRSTVFGGSSNEAAGTNATVTGGQFNTAGGDFAIVTGGLSNTAAADYSLAAGQRAQANHPGSFVWSDTTTVDPDFFTSTAPDQFLIKADGGVGIGTDMPTEMLSVAGRVESTTGGFKLPDGTIVDEAADLGTADGDTLGDLICADGEVAKWNNGAGMWECAADIDTDTNSDTLADLVCAAGEISKWNGANWSCAGDDTGGDGHSLDAADGVPINAVYVDNDGNVGIGTVGPDYPLHVTASTFRVVSAHNTQTTSTAWGVYGESDSSKGVGVRGVATHEASPNATGVSGVSASTTGRGVYGQVSAATGTNYAVYGSTSSPDAYGGYFVGRGYFSGEVGIGTNAPESQLHVSSNAAGYAGLIEGDATGLSGAALRLENTHAGGIALRADVNSTDATVVIGNAGTGSLLKGFGEPGVTFLVEGSGFTGIARSTPGFPLHVGTNSSTGNGAHVTTGGAWTNGSSRAWKHNFEQVDRLEILRKVVALPVTQWQYTGEGGGVQHIGPVAEDFSGAFGLGHDSQYITTVDADGVALAAIQGLHELLQEKECAITSQQQQISELQARLAAMEQRVSALAGAPQATE